MTKLNTEEHQILKKKKKNYIKQLRKNLRVLTLDERVEMIRIVFKPLSPSPYYTYSN